MAGTFEVTVPDIGDYKNVPVIEVLVKDGERVEKDAALITLESEKATVEVPAPQAGVVRGIKVKVGDKLNVGDVILALESESAAPSASADDLKSFSMTSAAAPSASADGLKSFAMSSAAAPEAAASTASSSLAVTVPDIGNYKDVPVIEVLVKDGDAVEKEAPLVVLESEKSTMEVPAPVAGIVRGLKLKPGSKVSQNDLICHLEGTGAAAVPVAAPAKPASVPAAQSAPAMSAPAKERTEDAAVVPPWAGQAGAAIAHASPSIRKLAREFGVDLLKVQGSGPKARITQDDVQNFVKKNLAPPPPAGGGWGEGSGIPRIPAVDFSQWGEIETKPLARIRKISAQYLHRAWLNIPHVTQHDQADITELEAFRKSQSEESGIKLTLLPFILKAVSAVLRQFPEFNASLAPDGENLILNLLAVAPLPRREWTLGLACLW